ERRRIAHGREQPGLRIEQRPRVEELGDLVRCELLPATSKRFQIEVAGSEDHLHLEQDAAFLQVDAGLEVRRMGIALRALHRLAGAGEATDLHYEMKPLEVEHALAG